MKGLRYITSTKGKKNIQDSITNQKSIQYMDFLMIQKFTQKKTPTINFVYKLTIVNKYLHSINSTLL